jgi:hypothetical protein
VQPSLLAGMNAAVTLVTVELPQPLSDSAREEIALVAPGGCYLAGDLLPLPSQSTGVTQMGLPSGSVIVKVRP